MNHSNYSMLSNDTPDVFKPNTDIPRYIYFYVLSLMLPVGLFGNLVCFAVFLRSQTLRRTTTGHYLIALAVADTLFLFGELIRWMHSTVQSGPILGIYFMDTILFWCRFTFYLRYAGKLASAWITVAICVERFITVAYPLNVGRISTPKIAKIAIILIFCMCFIIGAFPFWTLSIKSPKSDNTTYCGQTDKDVYEAWSMAILRIGSLFLPSAIIFLFTFLIIANLKKAHKSKMDLESEQNLNRKSSKKSIDFQLTVMLLGVAIAFLLLRLPYTISFYVFNHRRKIWGEDIDPSFHYKLFLTNKICDLFAISNYAVNIILYYLCGSSFRMRLRQFFQCHRGGKRRWSISSKTVSSKMSMSPRNSPPHD